MTTLNNSGELFTIGKSNIRPVVVTNLLSVVVGLGHDFVLTLKFDLRQKAMDNPKSVDETIKGFLNLGMPYKDAEVQSFPDLLEYFVIAAVSLATNNLGYDDHNYEINLRSKRLSVDLTRTVRDYEHIAFPAARLGSVQSS